jgi:hypothetical protein
MLEGQPGGYRADVFDFECKFLRTSNGVAMPKPVPNVSDCSALLRCSG